MDAARESAEAIVVGGGLFGAAIAYGLAQTGIDTAMLDGGDDAIRAARGNFGLVWVQSKGLGLQRYADWSRESAHLWDEFAVELRDASGIDVAHQRRGGLHLLLDDDEVAAKRALIERMRAQAGPAGYDCEINDRDDAQAMLPDIRLGGAVRGASFCPHDGHVNPLRLLRALHTGFTRAGGRCCPRRTVVRIARDGDGFAAETTAGRIRGDKIVLAAGHGIAALAPMVGLNAPIRPQRGQVLITERARPRIALPMPEFRQTDEGGFQFGSSEEDVGFDDGTTLAVTSRIAARAVRAFPELAGVRLVRSWGCLRVLTPDKCAIYDESETCPGAYVATSHSGVTLAAINARHIASWIATGERPPDFDQFSARRFDVPTAA